MSEPRVGRAPLLVLVNSNSDNPFSSYILEILDIEGFVSRDVFDLAAGDIVQAELNQYDIVILADVGSSADVSAQVAPLLERYVGGGGNLIALRPPKALANVFGLKSGTSLVNKRAKDRYIAFSRDHFLAHDLPCNSLQFHGEMDLYMANDADVLAHVAGDLDQPTGFAAVSTRSHGRGKAAAFAYDLAGSVVRQHQGRIENSSTGPDADADGDDRWIPNDLFVGQLDPRLKFVPQADVHQDLLVRTINWMSSSHRPVPRIWYFPDAAPCVTFFNGDSDGMSREDYQNVISMVEYYGGKFTVYLMEAHHALIDSSDEQALRSKGHSFGQHVILDLRTSVDDAEAEVARSLESFRRRYGYRPVTNRGHCLVWPGWTKMAEFLAAGGVRMDQNFIPRRFLQHGYLTASALPFKFMRDDGILLDIYEQNTHITDVGSVEADKFLLPGLCEQEVLQVALHMLDDCITRYHGVFQASFHPHQTVQQAMWLLEALVKRCQEENIPMVNGDEWVRFNDARRGVSIRNIAYDGENDRVEFRMSSDADISGVTVMVPAVFAGKKLAAVEVDGTASDIATKQLKGAEYGLLPMDIKADDVHLVRSQFV